MTTPAKIAANRRNALRSTGPRTVAGKLVVTRNPIKHGIFANLQVVPGESPDDWEEHRAGILSSLAPVGLLEANLADRISQLLWQQARLARFQSAAITANIEDAGMLPPYSDLTTAAFAQAGQQEAEILKCTELNLRGARRDHAEIVAVANLSRRLDELAPAEPVRRELAETLLSWAYGMVSDYPFKKFHPDHYVDPGFHAHVGNSAAGIKEVAWSPELLLRAIEYYKSAVDGTMAAFRADLQNIFDSRVAALAREEKRLEADRSAIVRRAENHRARAADAALLPPEQITERVMKYEKHLHGLLTSTLHELERLQARRGGMPVIPPAVADLNVTVNGD